MINLFIRQPGRKRVEEIAECSPFRTQLRDNNNNVQTLTTKDCKGPQTNMPKNVGSIKT